MRKKQAESAFPDFVLSICQEARPGCGEDSYCYCCCAEADLLAVFDGCGGLGAQRHKCYSDHTEAYMASRFCAGAFYAAFQHLFPLDSQCRSVAEDFFALSSDRCAEALRKYRPDDGAKARVLGTMVKTLPTTAASALVLRKEGQYAVHSIWAGDSRVYLLTPRGLAQLTIDDTTVADPMDNLYEDGILKNILHAERTPSLHHTETTVDGPFLVLAATDGCFNYFSTPMEFEWTILSALFHSGNAAEWEQTIRELIGRVAGDDYTLILSAYGFERFDRLKATYAARLKLLESEYIERISNLPLSDRTVRNALWDRYKQEYMRYI